MRIVGCFVLSFLTIATAALAEDSPQPEVALPGVIVEGSENVSVGGQSAARAGDATNTGNVVVEGSPDVLINGKSAAVQGGATDCGGIVPKARLRHDVVGGSSNVFINGKPVARAGDVAGGCPEQ
jgi:uncharacterized Zn-binding protein involved in type VI secretion